jgi:hypothetical protein
MLDEVAGGGIRFFGMITAVVNILGDKDRQ